MILGLLVWDRLELGRLFLFRYTDEDQTLLWVAAQNFLHGCIPEPCFYGQDYNSCLEGYLAAPLLFLHVLPYERALPTITMILGLLPFLLMAWLAWREGRAWLAGLALLVPLALPIRYALMTGMPRGYVTGIAVAIVPSLLIIRRPLSEPVLGAKPRWYQRWSLRYFVVGLLMVCALTVNPNCILLLAAALVYVIGTQWRHIELWVFGLLGALAGALYPLGVFFFYYVLHDDYRFYHRNAVYSWTVADFEAFWRDLRVPLGDFVPVGLPASRIDWVLGLTLGGVLLYLLVKRRWGAVAAGVAAIALTLVSFAYQRVHDGRSSVFYPYGRMYLAVPVLFVWLLLLAYPREKPTRWRALGPWISRSLLMVVAGLAILAAYRKHDLMPGQLNSASVDVQLVRLIEVAQARDMARHVQAAADSEQASCVLLGDDGWRWNYLLPALTNCETLFPFFERRTWRLHEECLPRYDRILVLERTLFERAHANGYTHAQVVSESPFVGAFDTNGQSVIRICQELNIRMRTFDVPANSDVLR
jgi:hypothetical protein